jgi:hypothetical protein
MDAKVHFNLVLELEPDYAAAASDLAWLLATKTNEATRNMEEAVRCVERACELAAQIQSRRELYRAGWAYAVVPRVAGL